uniref:Cysteine--tRNA ligase, cytoplasmic n=1 Tax=Caenorhabditis japonica TaxID=281687 RepID=A0A8R1I866_CAEJA
MGHARSYLSLDILRRVFRDYFGYDVEFIMNITDVDDKIIKRGRQRHLLKSYFDESQAPSVIKVCEDVVAALEHFHAKFEAEVDPDKKKMLEVMIKKVQTQSTALETAMKAQDPIAIENAKGQLLNESRDVLSEWLDHHHGKDVRDHSVFDQLAKTYENEFFADMARLNVLPVDVLTRVSEYVPEVITYVKTIINNGYAYATEDGSVYFDTKAFEHNPKHFYAKLVPEAYGDDSEALLKNMREGEGELSMSDERLKSKRSPNDFALWKSSKDGEPFWPSEWGNGRPGWHIECSVMSSAICGSKLDIHAGGFDLKFPHHDNEIAQVEAHYDDPHWVNYFLHCGTLRIQGMKMSKSLKNFITIREALKQYTPRQLRLLFLMHNWADVLDYSASTMERALQFEKVTNEFFLLVKDILRRNYKPESSQGYQKYQARELKLMDDFGKLKKEVHEALCDSVDTRTVVEKLRELISLGNVYINEKEKEQHVPNCLLLRNIATYITNLLKMFGAITQSNQEIGFVSEDETDGQGASTSFNKEAVVMPYLTALAEFREKVRNIGKEHKINGILEECDVLRDKTLTELGVRLEDRNGQTVVKLVDRATLLREQEQKEAEKKRKDAEKADKERKAREKADKEAAAKRIKPEELFKQGEHAGKFSQFDARGVPTHLADGTEISKSQLKKLEKMYEAQKKKYQV